MQESTAVRRDPMPAAAARAQSRVGRFAEVGLPASGVLIGVLLVLGPFLATVIRSLLYWDRDQVSLSLQNFVGLFGDPRFYQAVGNTVICGAGATICSCLLGFSLAWIVSRTDLPGRRWFEIFNLVPFFLSPYVGAVSWIYLAAPHSGVLSRLLNQYLGLPDDFIRIYSLGGVIWVVMFVLGGYWFGQLEFVKHHFGLVELGIIFISVLPMAIEFLRARKKV